ncbi:discoidin domain-containing protein [Paenibacillus agilis]|uniref:Discoidin domain-containing protein n=1 Tax=Paenibacillus agilis TaxID=3020863 RepID=A0A559IEK6_9BACL|nr:discoidin domain-containing protein [Paenibacillus agilis]TVX86097.1 discoidin domain-containing protein [Paenibacillus agilis]
MATKEMLPQILRGRGGDTPIFFDEIPWGNVIIKGEMFVHMHKSKNIHVYDVKTLKYKRTLVLPSLPFGNGVLGTDGEKLYTRLAESGSEFMIKEIDIQTGAKLGDLIQPATNISNSIASFCIVREWNMILMPNYDARIFMFDLTSGANLGVKTGVGVESTSAISIINNEYIGVLTYPSSFFLYAKVEEFNNVTANKILGMNFKSVKLFPTNYICGMASVGEFIFTPRHQADDKKLYWSSMKNYTGNDNNSERHLILHDGKYKTFNPRLKVKGLKSLIPTMTSDNSHGIASASASLDQNTGAFRVFDDNPTTYWTPPLKNGISWISYEFPSPMIFNAYHIQSSFYAEGFDPSNWDVEVWDGLKWITVDERREVKNWSHDGVVHMISNPNGVAYKKIRWKIYQNSGNKQPNVGVNTIKVFNINDGQGGWYDYSTATPSDYKDILNKGIKNIDDIKLEDWAILSNKNPKIKLIRYSNENLSSFAKEKEDVAQVKDSVNSKLYSKFLPFNQIAIPLSNISINEDIEKFDVTMNIEYHERFKLFVSFDNGMTWDSFKKGSWRNIDIHNELDIIQNGMKISEFELLRTKDFAKKAVYGFVKIGFMVEIDENEKEIVDVDGIKAFINAFMIGSEISSSTFYILNTTSTINISFEGNKLSGTLSDYDMGMVQYRVILNDKPYFPETGDFSKFFQSPEPIAINVQNKDLKMGQSNKIRIEFKDYWGNMDFWERSFIGTWAGLMFSDPTGQYYTTDIGDLLKYLQVGSLTAGQTSVENKIRLTNMYGYKVQDIKINAINSNLPTGVKLELSKTQFPFTPEQELSWNTILDNNRAVEFFARLATVHTANSVPNGKFEIRAKAKKI